MPPDLPVRATAIVADEKSGERRSQGTTMPAAVPRNSAKTPDEPLTPS
jgi:hypothetical protein